MRRLQLLLLALVTLTPALTPALTHAATTQPTTRPSNTVAFVTVSQVLLQNPQSRGEPLAAWQARLNARFLNLADDVVRIAWEMGATDAIVWDASLDDYQDIKYVGDPRLHHARFGADIARQFFKRLRDGGLTPGVTIREGWLVRDLASGRMVYAQADKYAWSMIAKAAWAQENYGALNFYCDSTVDERGFPRDVRPLVLLQQQMPTARWYLENVGVPQDGVWRGYGRDDYKSFARFLDPRHEKITDDGFRHLVGQMDAWDPSREQEYVDAANRGDRFCYYGWWDSSFNKGLKLALAKASQEAH